MQLHIRAIDGKYMPAKDANGLSDPYLVLKVGDKTQKTVVAKDTLNPTWNQEFHFDLKDVDSDVLDIEVFDEDIAKDDSMGKAQLQIASYKDGVAKMEQVKLPKPKKAKRSPVVNLQIQVLPAGQTPFQSDSKYKLQFTVIEAKDVPKADLIGKTDPFIVMSMSGTQTPQATTVKDNTFTPVWNESFTFDVSDKAIDHLTITLMDKDPKQDDAISTYDLSLAGVADNTEIDQWLDLTATPEFKKAKSGGSVHVKYTLVAKEGEKKEKKKHHKKHHQSGGAPAEEAPVEEAPAPAPAEEAPVDTYHELKLYIEVTEAKGIKKCDSYARVTFAKNEPLETEKVVDSTDPVFTRSFAMKVGDYTTSDLKVEIVRDKIGKDKVIGTVNVPWKTYAPGDVVDKWFPLENKKKQGQLHLRIHLARDNDERFQEKPFKLMHFETKVVEAHKVPKADAVGKTDPYIVLSIPGTKYLNKTSVKDSTYDPVWNETFDFVITSIDQVVKFELMDKDVAKDDVIATHEIAMSTLTLEEKVDATQSFTPSKEYAKKDPAEVHLNYRLYLAGPEAPKEEKGSDSEYEYVSGSTPSLTMNKMYSSAKSLSSWSSSDEKAADISEIHLKRVKKGTKPAKKPKQTSNDQLVLHARIVGATNLPAADANGKSDPYCVITMNNQKEQTKAIQNTLNPEWNQEFHLNVINLKDDKVRLAVFDEDIMRDDELGHIEIPMTDMVLGKLVDQTFPLVDKKGKKAGKLGDLHVVLHVAELGKAPFVEYALVVPVLNVNVIECTDVEKMDLGSSDPYVTLGLKGAKQDQKTKAIQNTVNPVWNENFVIPLTSAATDVLELTLWDEDVANDDKISTLQIPLSAYTLGQVVEDVFPMTGVSKKIKHPGKLHLKLQIAPKDLPPFTEVPQN